jgi:hypothetical protein
VQNKYFLISFGCFLKPEIEEEIKMSFGIVSDSSKKRIYNPINGLIYLGTLPWSSG